MSEASDFSLLFAEDNPEIRALYKSAFEKEGFHVFTCDNAAQALAELKAEKIDLLVTDLEMPKANTLELFPILKKEYPKLPVVVVSGHYRDLREDFSQKGFKISAYLNKPIGVTEVKNKVKEILGIVTAK
jgi:CheY-like chemotaxis protein